MQPLRSSRTPASILRSPTFVVAVAFVFRMVLLWLSHYHENPSQPRFETVGTEAGMLAASLAAHRGFFGPYPGYATFTACLAPVYPFLWSLGLRLFHLSDFGAVVFSQAMNCAFSAATCWPIYATGKKIFGEKTGLAAAWAWVVLPYAVLLPLEWTWDQSLSALLLAVIVYVTFELRESPSALVWFGYGLLWAFAALTNPTLCFLLPFFLGWLVVLRWRTGRPSLLLAARAMLIFALALMPWTIRNYYVIGDWFFVKSNFGLEFWLGNNPAVKEIYSAELHPISSFRERIALILSGEPNYNREKQHEAIAFIKSHPRIFLKNSWDRFVDNWAAIYDAGTDPWIRTLHLIRADIWFSSIFSLVSFAGLILGLRAKWREVLPLAMCLLLFPIPYYITHTALRYRHPIDPFMTILTVVAIERLWSALFSSAKSRTQTVAHPGILSGVDAD
jgi:hypothetical protein